MLKHSMFSFFSKKWTFHCSLKRTFMMNLANPILIVLLWNIKDRTIAFGRAVYKEYFRKVKFRSFSTAGLSFIKAFHSLKGHLNNSKLSKGLLKLPQRNRDAFRCIYHNREAPFSSPGSILVLQRIQFLQSLKLNSCMLASVSWRRFVAYRNICLLF